MRSIVFLGLCGNLLLLTSCGSKQDVADAENARPESSAQYVAHEDLAAHGQAHRTAGHDQSRHPVDRDTSNAHHDETHHWPHGDHDGHHPTNLDGGKHHDDGHHVEHEKRGDHASDRKPLHGESDANTRGDLIDAADDLSGLSAAEMFDRRILPILRSGKATSCTECHFGGVELRNYIHEDQATTFAALRDAEWIDVEAPDKSKLLTFIARRPNKEDPLLAKVRRNEYQVFRAWIHAAVQNPDLLAAKATETPVGTDLPVEVIRHMRRDRVLQSFVENIWSEMGRCVNCHSPDRNQRQVREHGEQVSWIVPGDPVATLEKLVEGDNIDTDHPGESMVLLKPVGLEDHGGGPKFAVGSRTDKNFRRFLNDYAAVVNGKYQRKEQLPQPSRDIAVLTGQHLRIVDLPADLDQKLLKADIYRWTDSDWSLVPWGTAENPINGKKNMWQSMVFMVAQRGSKRAEELRHAKDFQLPHGRYLVKIYIDQHDQTKADRDYTLGDAELYGKVEIDGPWPPGYEPPKIIHAPVKK